MYKPKELERRSGSSQSLPLFLVRAEALWPRLGRDIHSEATRNLRLVRFTPLVGAQTLEGSFTLEEVM